jgi:hypothetical protein
MSSFGLSCDRASVRLRERIPCAPGRNMAWKEPMPSALPLRVILSLALLLCGLLSPLHAGSDKKRSPLPDPRLASSGPELVEIGFWPTVLYNLDVHSNTFYATSYVWFRWKGDLDPSETVEFVNNVESWGLTKVKTYPKPVTLPDGRLYQCLRIEGRFFQPFSLKRFPLEHHRVSVSVEDNTYDASKILYTFDHADSGIDPSVEIPGWKIRNWNGTAGIHHYPTNLGDLTVGREGADYGCARFELEVSRPMNFFLWKLILPVLIVLIANWTALMLHPSQLASRVAMTGTALLTTVFLEQGYSSNLPEVNYLVLMDKIYVVVYLLIIASLIQVVIQGALEKRHQVNEFRRAQTVDRVSVVIQATLFALSLFFINATTR